MSEDEGRGGGCGFLARLVVKPTHCASQKAYLLMRSHEDPTEFRYRVGASPWPCVVPPESFFSPFLGASIVIVVLFSSFAVI